MSTPRERQIEEFMRRLAAGEIDLDTGRVRRNVRELILRGMDLTAAEFRVALVSAAPHFTYTTFDDISDLVVASRPIHDMGVVSGALDGSDVTFPAIVAKVPVVGAVILADDLILGYTPFPGPAVLTGGDFTVCWDNGPNRIMRL